MGIYSEYFNININTQMYKYTNIDIDIYVRVSAKNIQLDNNQLEHWWRKYLNLLETVSAYWGN